MATAIPTNTTILKTWGADTVVVVVTPPVGSPVTFACTENDSAKVSVQMYQDVANGKPATSTIATKTSTSARTANGVKFIQL